MTCATRAFRESPRSLSAQRRVERPSFSGGQPPSVGNRRRASDRPASTQLSAARRWGQQIVRRRALLNGAASAIAKMLQYGNKPLCLDIQACGGEFCPPFMPNSAQERNKWLPTEFLS
ncbi:hypothetical protein HPB50_022640 [Hyalomma asiaticum]|uniref:Uncharacterized protein n=1 Tax=Hyalomma asiaticum TaxID=266040 RepID=A0ACB7RYZ3_HYAAI|nr:hypothetical protein HPB50_022640 [Hyalomma asiaticum]